MLKYVGMFFIVLFVLGYVNALSVNSNNEYAIAAQEEAMKNRNEAIRQAEQARNDAIQRMNEARAQALNAQMEAQQEMLKAQAKAMQVRQRIMEEYGIIPKRDLENIEQ